MAAGAKAAALALAAVVHAGALLAIVRDEVPERPEGVETTQIAVAGAAFGSFAAPVSFMRPERIASASPVQPLPPVPTARTETMVPRSPAITASVAPVRVSPQGVARAAPPVAPDVLAPAGAAPSEPPARATALAPADGTAAAPPPAIDAKLPVGSGQIVTGAEPANAAPTRSVRPQMHARVFAAPERPDSTTEARPAPRAEQRPKAQTAPGAESTTAAAAPRAARAPGIDAAAKAYPRQVYQRLARAGRIRVQAPGPASVSFTITSGGGLGAVSIAKSSGNVRFDRAALDTVRRAAPFPRPPKGAQRHFTIALR